MVSPGEPRDPRRGRYFLALPTFARRDRFRDPRIVAETDRIFRDIAAACAFQFLAYCYLPDQLELLIEAAVRPVDPAGFLQQARAASGMWHANRYLTPLWQAGWRGHALDHEEEVDRCVRRLLAAPVRAGLVDHWDDWPYSGSNVIRAPTPRSARPAPRSSRARR